MSFELIFLVKDKTNVVVVIGKVSKKSQFGFFIEERMVSTILACVIMLFAMAIYKTIKDMILLFMLISVPASSDRKKLCSSCEINY